MAVETEKRVKPFVGPKGDPGTPGIQGPKGDKGDPGDPAEGGIATQTPKLIVTFDTDMMTEPNDLLYLNGDSFVSTLSDNDPDLIPNGIFGVGIAKPTSSRVDVLFTGVVPGYLGFTPGVAVFLGTDGKPTHQAPTTGIVQRIGFAISATELFVQIQQAFRRS